MTTSEVQRNVDQEKAEKLVRKIKKGKGFSLEDFQSQLVQMQTMGGIGSMMEKLPGMNDVPDHVRNKVDDRHTRHMIAIINSIDLTGKVFSGCYKGVPKEADCGWIRH